MSKTLVQLFGCRLERKYEIHKGRGINGTFYKVMTITDGKMRQEGENQGSLEDAQEVMEGVKKMYEKYDAKNTGMSSLRDRIALAAVKRELADGDRFVVYWEDEDGVDHKYIVTDTIEEAREEVKEARREHKGSDVTIWDMVTKKWVK